MATFNCNNPGHNSTNVKISLSRSFCASSICVHSCSDRGCEAGSPTLATSFSNFAALSDSFIRARFSVKELPRVVDEGTRLRLQAVGGGNGTLWGIVVPLYPQQQIEIVFRLLGNHDDRCHVLIDRYMMVSI